MRAGFIPPIEREGGNITSFLGDGVMALFRGADHAARHVASGREHSLAAAANWSRLDAESLTRTRRRRGQGTG